MTCLLETFDPICFQALGYKRLANSNRIGRGIAVRMLLSKSLHLFKYVILQFFYHQSVELQPWVFRFLG